MYTCMIRMYIHVSIYIYIIHDGYVHVYVMTNDYMKPIVDACIFDPYIHVRVK